MKKLAYALLALAFCLMLASSSVSALFLSWRSLSTLVFESFNG